jgi:DNA-binding response OmpR family regulator
MNLQEVLVKYINTPYILVAALVVILFVVYQYFKKNRFPAENIIQGTNLEREFGLSLIGLEDEVQLRSDEDDERSAFTPSVFSTDSSPAILVVEPNEDMRLFITNALRLNYRVIALSDGPKAFQKACEVVPDLVIINTYIGGMEGMTLCETLKSNQVTNHIPVIMLTAKGEVGQSSENIVSKCDSFLVKPFDARELLLSVRDLIDKRKRHHVAFRDQISAVPAFTDFAPADVEFLLKLFYTLETNYHNPAFGVEHLAKEFSFLKLQLFRKLKALANRTPGDFIRFYRIERAKLLLAKDIDSIGLIATKVGFTNLTTFNKVFRDYTGVSPAEFSAQTKASVDNLME